VAHFRLNVALTVSAKSVAGVQVTRLPLQPPPQLTNFQPF